MNTKVPLLLGVALAGAYRSLVSFGVFAFIYYLTNYSKFSFSLTKRIL